MGEKKAKLGLCILVIALLLAATLGQSMLQPQDVQGAIDPMNFEGCTKWVY